MKYVEYLISTPQNYTCSNLADHLERNHLANCYHAWLTLKARTRTTNHTVYAIKRNLLRDYLCAELWNPTIPA